MKISLYILKFLLTVGMLLQSIGLLLLILIKEDPFFSAFDKKKYIYFALFVEKIFRYFFLVVPQSALTLPRTLRPSCNWTDLSARILILMLIYTITYSSLNLLTTQPHLLKLLKKFPLNS